MDVAASLRAHWRQAPGLRLAPGLAPADLDAFERRSGLTLPADLRAALQLANGFIDDPLHGWDDVDAEGFQFLPLESARLSAGRYFTFCRWCLGFNDYAVDLGAERNGEVLEVYEDVRGGISGRVLAPSFAAFIALYVADSTLLYGDRQGLVRRISIERAS